jgi:hypothetical protein
MNPNTRGSFLAQQIEADMAQDGQILAGMTNADTCFIFTIGEIEDLADPFLQPSNLPPSKLPFCDPVHLAANSQGQLTSEQIHVLVSSFRELCSCTGVLGQYV